MSTFKLEKYMPGDAVTDTEETPNTEVREIKITRLDQRPLTGVIAEALISTLKQDNIDLVHFESETSGVLKDVRVVSLEDINNSLTESTKFALGGDVIVLDRINGTTPAEEMFLNNIDEKEKYHDIVSFGERGVPLIMDMPVPVTDVGIEDVSVDEEALAGKFSHGGKDYEVITIEGGVLVAKEVVGGDPIEAAPDVEVTTDEDGHEINPEDEEEADNED